MKSAVVLLLVLVLLTAPVVIAVKPVRAASQMWTQTYGGPDNDSAWSLVATSDGGYAIAGTTGATFDDLLSGDYWLVKLDSDCNVQWNQTYDRGGRDSGCFVVQTTDGGYAISGYSTSSFLPDISDFWLVKTDSAGMAQWNQTYGGTESDTGYSVIETSDGGYTLAGETASYGAGESDFWLVKTDASGTAQWNQTYGGPDSDVACSLVTTHDGGYTLAGSTYSFGVGGQDFWLVKTDEYGVVPEATWVVLPLMVAATLAIFICKKKLFLQQSRAS